MTNQPISVLVLRDASKNRQVDYCAFRKTDASAVLEYIAELESRLAAPWPALRAIAFGEASEDDYKALEAWLFANAPEEATP